MIKICFSWACRCLEDSSKFEVAVTLQLTVSQTACLGIEHPCGTCDQILLPVGMLFSKIWGLLSVGCPSWQKDVSAICSVITQWSESSRTCSHTLLSHLRLPQPGGLGSRIYEYIPREQGGPVIVPALGSLYVASCDSQGYSGGILTLPQPWGPGLHIYIPQEQDGPVQSQNSVTSRPTLRQHFLCYHWKGCMWSMQCNVEFWYHQSIWGPRKTLIELAGRRTFQMQTGF
jgi:hypothetical protein